MLVESGKLLHVYEEIQQAGYRLGRHMELDARSLEFAVEMAWPRPTPIIKPAEHPPVIPTLDQGNVGSCTGNAGAYALSSLVGSPGLLAAKLDGFMLAEYQADLDEQYALAVYHEATVNDGLPDPPYPTNDRGSTGLGVCKALKKAGLIGAYNWASTVRGLGLLLQRQGVMIGTPWFQAWFQPDAHGFVDSASIWGPVVGGHEVYVEALEHWDDHDPGKSVIRFKQSWGSWGDHGSGRMRLSTYVRNQSQCDVKQLVAKKV